MGHISSKEQQSLARDNGSLFIARLRALLLICLMKLDRRKYHFRFSTTLPRFRGFFRRKLFPLCATITYFLQLLFRILAKLPPLRGVFDECGGIGGLLGRYAGALQNC
ncbi:hypothetical protein AVEN_205460-1 [Araneus ventricosus]|uniref:Uncharacterized protein n=1 Tax=Araneus ventricosus TaxID=182803 RepID=A0A4Y2CEP1_ARAVE|nr:hypothetical protein AVEN_205460-1 [Araneus ventricosus]